MGSEERCGEGRRERGGAGGRRKMIGMAKGRGFEGDGWWRCGFLCRRGRRRR
jgi:hypothetical protein